MGEHPRPGREVATQTAIDLETDALFDVLSDSRRRFVLACVDEYATPMALADIADELAENEYDSPLPEVPADAVRSIYISLYHVHIPKLAAAGLVEYSQERDDVTPTEECEGLGLSERSLGQF